MREIQRLRFGLNGCTGASAGDEIAGARLATVNGKTVPGPLREPEIAAGIP